MNRKPNRPPVASPYPGDLPPDVAPIPGHRPPVASPFRGVALDKDIASWWRPAMMVCIMALLFVNYALLPLLSVFWPGAHPIIFPDKFWELIAVIVGLYVAGRSGEKIARTMRNDTSSN